MKQILLIGIGIMLILYTITIGFSAFSTQTRKNEMEKSVSRIVESTLMQHYKSGTEEQVQQNLMDEITQSLGIDADVVVTVRECDLQKGIISVKVEENFLNFNGKSRILTCEKTAIMEQHWREEDMVLVRFMVGTEIYKEYQLVTGECCPIPKLPSTSYAGWFEQGTSEVVEEIGQVWEDKVYVAIME